MPQGACAINASRMVSVLRRPIARIAERRVDLVLTLFGALFGWASLTYPFGRDQGLYYYVGREWALRGSIPYRDVFDHKTPGIYFVHGVCVTIFGETFWGIRLADLLAVLALGWVAGAIVSSARDTRHVPLRGLGAFAASVQFFGFLDFKTTCEAEVWIALAILGAIALARSRFGTARSDRAARFASGALAGVALVMKPSAAPMVLVVVALIVWDARRAIRKVAGALLLFSAGAAGLLGLVLLYFLAHGALQPAYEIVVEANQLYVSDGNAGLKPDLMEHTKIFFEWHRPGSYALTLLLAVAFVRASVHKDLDALGSHVLAVLLCSTAWASVVLQGKYFHGHWGVMVAGTTVAVLSVTADAVKVLPARATRWIAPASCAVCAALYATTGDRFTNYKVVNRAAFGWVTGKISRDEFTSHFDESFASGAVSVNEACGRWLRDHTSASDFIAVRGFQPQVYATARRRYPGRLFWTVFVLGPGGAARRAQWLEEDRRLLAANPPKYAATFDFVHDNTEGTEWWVARGYTVRTKIGDFTIVEHTPETATQPW